MFIHTLKPILFTLGPFEIRWYGIMYAIGFLFAYLVLPYLSEKKNLKITKDDWASFLFWLVIFGLAGARIAYILVGDISFYTQNPLEILMLWHGGLAFHGAFFAGIIYVYFFCKKHNLHFYDIADLVVIPLAFGQAIGRIGNFINAEMIGKPTDLPWGEKYPGIEGYRHPVSLYATFKDTINFSVLWFLNENEVPKGTIFWSFVAIYSSLRFVKDFFQEGATYYGLQLPQWIGLVLFAVAVVFLWKTNKNH